MSDTQSTTETPAESGQGQEPKTETFSREYVEGLRQEAAKYRNEKKDAVEAAKTEARAETIREYEEKAAEKDATISDLQSKLNDSTLELTKLKAVVEAKIPVEDILDVVTLVQGTDEETVSESVKRVKALLDKAPASQSPVDHTQGAGGGVVPLNGDPVLNVLKRAVGAK
ncbi:scaffolding protein [Mycobacterium phage Panamaxus]|uniref:Scaffolding protein n=1 Tax=Mycobacterium phage Veracruz TaxID=2530154 RepID=A0A481VSQ5_9CAUD|nr:head scaffolding protein [Mycobacterium phage Veracruz]AIS73688.1 scaffolding protein [Mycobacterium phage QuinnKiro]ALA11817.1 scaffolding protein [Mycobacterium phage Texage]AOT24164.1 scaffolding protein [Mycobacterium phage Todacoro]AOT25517.1 scaffolding protein [Mycobacterium phage Margo]AUX82311.1 scaffolding protein [Mycobacterium phage Lambert1]AVP42940.1 scaffolding protein [Mycobacterium phage Panamaxus]AWY03546.1 scaffolding protein [Mycobacterium phage Hookmount]AYR03394.1 s